MAKVKAAPQTARLITINNTDGKSYDVVPGGDGSVEVVIPNRLAHGAFVQVLIKQGDLILTEDGDIEDLRAQAEELGIQVDKRWKASRLQQEIDKDQQ